MITNPHWSGLLLPSVVYCVLPSKGVIKSLHQNPPPTVTIDPNTYRELEIVRQTLIAVEKMKKNGDCIAEGELGVRSLFPYAEDGDENH